MAKAKVLWHIMKLGMPFVGKCDNTSGFVYFRILHIIFLQGHAQL